MQNKFDLIIIGGGAAGMMSAISAKRNHPEYEIAIIDRTFALGRKILVCGAGRCNITNINLDKSFADHYYGAETEFLESVFSQFSYKNIISFFEDLGIEVYVERKTDIGKIFPKTDQAKTVTALLEDELDRLKIKVFLNTEITEIEHNNIFNLKANKLNNNEEIETNIIFESDYIIISAGGKTYPALGSNGSGYKLAESLGHSIITPVPSALPLISKNPLSQELQGQKFEMEVTSIIEGKIIKSRIDDVMFTQYGLSGPAILNISREISIHINRYHKSKVEVKLNFFPGKNSEEVLAILKDRWKKRPQQTVEKSLYGIFPNKFPLSILKLININRETIVSDLDDNLIEKLVDILSGYIVQIQGTKSWNEAEFTAGGINTNEVNLRTLSSKIIKNLYFCGEILDVDGDVGGFNLSWAWCSGFVAGKLQ